MDVTQSMFSSLAACALNVPVDLIGSCLKYGDTGTLAEPNAEVRSSSA
ncbi:hypothetical protein ACFT9I_05725 [Streptomyces sp. NPDC057137]